jgi:hypothetical protein
MAEGVVMLSLDTSNITNAEAFAKAIILVRNERERQEEKWGQQNHDSAKWNQVLAEEIGEAAKDAMEKGEGAELTEVIQVAAVALAWAETILRRQAVETPIHWGQ